MRNYLLISFLFIFCSAVSAQAPNILRSSVDPTAPRLVSDCQDVPGHHYYAGNYVSSVTHIYLSEVDAGGQILWERVAVGSPCDETVQEMDADAHSIYVAGFSIDTVTGQPAGMIVRFRPNGFLQWRIRISGGAIKSIECTPDGGIIAAGSSSVVRMDSSGAVTWFRHDSLATQPHLDYTDVFPDSTGAFYCIGTCYANSGLPFGVITKCDSAGTVKWTKQYGTNSNPYGFACGIVRDSSIYLAGRVMWPDVNGNFDALLLVRLDTSGVPLNWTMSTPSFARGYDVKDLLFTPYQTIVIGGRTYDNAANENGPFLAEFDKYTFTFMRAIHHVTFNNYPTDLSMDASGNTSFCGNAPSGPEYDVYYGIMDYNWNAGCGFTSLSMIFSNTTIPYLGLTPATDQPFGYEIYGGDYPVTIIWDSCVNSLGLNENVIHNSSISVTPDPAGDYCSVQFEEAITSDMTLEILDVEGRLVKTISAASGSSSVTVNTMDLNCGMYFVRTENGVTGKFVVER